MGSSPTGSSVLMDTAMGHSLDIARLESRGLFLFRVDFVRAGGTGCAACPPPPVDVDLLRLRQPLQKDMQHAERPACVRHAAAAYSFRIEDRARAFAVMCSPLWGSNPRPYAYEAHALPTELKRLTCRIHAPSDLAPWPQA